MQDNNGLIAIHIPIGTGKRATRVKLPGDCALVSAEYGGLRQAPHYDKTGPKREKGGKPQVKLVFRLVETYDKPIERLFRVVDPKAFPEDLGARFLGTVAQIRHPDNKDPNAVDWEVLEMERHDVGTRVSDIQKTVIVRGLNRLVFEHAEVVRVNGCEVASKQLKLGKDGLFYEGRGVEGQMLGGQRRHKQAGMPPLQWELRYQTRRRLKEDVGWAFIGTSADEADGAVPARLKLWRTLRVGLHIWLSENLFKVANA